MPRLLVTTRDGEVSDFDATTGQSLLVALFDNGIDDLMALCGGCVSCGTCHVYVEAGDAESPQEISEDEELMLSSLTYRDQNSRLACQVELHDKIEELRITIAPEE